MRRTSVLILIEHKIPARIYAHNTLITRKTRKKPASNSDMSQVPAGGDCSIGQTSGKCHFTNCDAITSPDTYANYSVEAVTA